MIHAESAEAAADVASQSLRKTSLFGFHRSRNAKMTAFAGYEMPLQYGTGILSEHLQTRRAAGLFDVSHMGLLQVRAKTGTIEDAASALESVVPVDLIGLQRNRQRYGFLLDDAGGIIDDLMVARLDARFLVITNAANKETDEAYLRARLPRDIDIEVLPNALLALQGPKAEAVLKRLIPHIADLAFLEVCETTDLGEPCFVSRSGYTGEDGFELSIRASAAPAFVEALLTSVDVGPVGLGARDSLRLEAGLCLHGQDIDRSTTPVEAGLAWAISPARRRGGARAGGFPGADLILSQIEEGPARRRVGLRPAGHRTPVRAGTVLFAAEDDRDPVGRVTSGGYGPSLEAPIAMGYVPTALSRTGQQLFAEVRGRRLALAVCALPFVPAHFKRAGVHSAR